MFSEFTPSKNYADELKRLAKRNQTAFADREYALDFRKRILNNGIVYRSDKRTTGFADLWSDYLSLVSRYGAGILYCDCEDQAAMIAGWWKATKPDDVVEVGILPGITVSHAVARINGHIVDLCIYTGMGPMPHGYNESSGDWRTL
jgi:hypothetical protein